MRHLLLLLALVCLTNGPACADGAQAAGRKLALPPPQSSVAVTVERGVRVWRPLGTDGGVEAGYEQPVSLGDYGVAGPAYAAPGAGGGGGVFGGYGGYGSRHQRSDRHGMKSMRGYGVVQSKSVRHGPKRTAMLVRAQGKPHGRSHGHR